MSQFIFGDGELVQAINTATSRQISERCAESILNRAWERAGIEGVKQVASEYGINYALNEFGYPVYYTIGGMEGATELTSEVLYRTALETSVDTATNEIVFEGVKQTATQNGLKTLLGGGVKTATSAINIIGAVATGAQLGWDSYKAHPDFWTDLSESVFNTYKSPDTPVEVLARAYSGGYTTAVKEKEICKILQGLADNDAFDYDTYETELDPETGSQHISVQASWTPVGPAGGSVAMGLAFAKSISVYPNDIIIQTRDGNDRAYVFSCPSNNLPTGEVGASKWSAYGTGQQYYTCDESITCHVVFCVYDESTETASYTGIDGSTSSVNDIVSGTVKSYYDTTIGGFNTTPVAHVGNNELFPNNHNSNLHIAPNTPLNTIANNVKTAYPDWYGDSWVQDEYDVETGNTNSERYYPVTTPWWDTDESTQKDPNYTPNNARRGDVYQEPDDKAKPQGQENTKNNERINTDPKTKPYTPIVPPSDTPPDVGGGSGTTSTGLWCVYNPTMQELNDLGGYLWTNNIVELLEKFLQNPMDAIISLHKVYCQPENGSREDIMLGYLNSGVSALTVTDQFIEIDCGTIAVPEYFEDARDYDSPYTTVECYLPFVGIVKLKTQDIIGGKVNIVYTVDVYSGACLCKIFVTKVGAKQLLYNFSGNCSMQIPLTGADRTRLLSGAITGALTGAFMGAEVGAVVGAIGGAWMGGTSIDRTSQFSANAGCMGVKKPYLIITRKYSYDAGNYNKYYGFPTNITVSLNTCKGFTKVKSVHIENMLRATDNEKVEIETLLKEGVIIN